MTDNVMYNISITSDGNPLVLNSVTGFDWVHTRNLDVWAAAAPIVPTGVEYYWNKWMLDNSALEITKTPVTGASVTSTILVDGVIPFDVANFGTYTAPVLVAGILAGPPPTVQTANTAGLNTGDFVQLSFIAGGQQLISVPFEINNVVAGVSFDLRYMPAIVAAPAPGAAATWRKLNGPEYMIPMTRYIASITNAAAAVVTFTTRHRFVVGNRVRFTIPAAYGMGELNGQTVRITAVTASTITLDLDTTGYAAFAFPAAAAFPFSPAVADLEGSAASNVNADSSVTSGYSRGVILGAGVNAPMGVFGDVINIQAGMIYRY